MGKPKKLPHFYYRLPRIKKELRLEVPPLPSVLGLDFSLVGAGALARVEPGAFLGAVFSFLKAM